MTAEQFELPPSAGDRRLLGLCRQAIWQQGDCALRRASIASSRFDQHRLAMLVRPDGNAPGAWVLGVGVCGVSRVCLEWWSSEGLHRVDNRRAPRAGDQCLGDEHVHFPNPMDVRTLYLTYS